MKHYICVRFMVAVSNVVLLNVVNTVKTFFLFKLASIRQVQQSDYVKQSRLSMTKLRGG